MVSTFKLSEQEIANLGHLTQSAIILFQVSLKLLLLQCILGIWTPI